MPTDSPWADLEILVVGALTIDRFADGTVAPGGSVLHSTRALALDRQRAGVVTVAADDPVSRGALDELAGLAALHAEPAAATVTFEHVETPAGRVLTLAEPAATLISPRTAERPASVLYAAVAGELTPEVGGQRYDGARTGAILQGWLRSLEPGRTVVPLPLASLAPEARGVLARCDLLIASREDLLADADDAERQLDAMRATFGGAPVLVVTVGIDGAWLDTPGGGRSAVPAPFIARDVPMVGAGDGYAAVMLAAMGRGAPPDEAAAHAARLTAEWLAARAR
jgi:sugar/nucleoside kinase (ribokinase family)